MSGPVKKPNLPNPAVPQHKSRTGTLRMRLWCNRIHKGAVFLDGDRRPERSTRIYIQHFLALFCDENC